MCIELAFRATIYYRTHTCRFHALFSFLVPAHSGNKTGKEEDRNSYVCNALSSNAVVPTVAYRKASDVRCVMVMTSVDVFVAPLTCHMSEICDTDSVKVASDVQRVEEWMSVGWERM